MVRSRLKQILVPEAPAAAALGMALSYYCFPFLTPHILAIILFFIVFLVCFLRVLRFSPLGPSFILKTGILVMAAAAGFTLGIAARRSLGGPAEMGLAPERITSLSGILREDPRTLQGASGLGTLELRQSGGAAGLRATARGRITVFFPPESIPTIKDFGRGSEIFVEGRYSSGNRGPVFNASSVHIVKPAGALERFRTGLRLAVLERFRQGQEAPIWGALASAMLLGVRDDLDVDLSDAFRNSGSSHILALSGMHLAVISALLAFVLKGPLGLRWASLVGGIFIILYVFAAGSQPSLVRAAIMYLLGVFSLWASLKGKTLSLLSMAFILQLLFQGESGISLSFILSYLALFGIITLGNSFSSLFRGRVPPILSGGLSISLGAFIMTAPVVAFYFGTIRPIGIITGIIVSPLCSLFMIFALAALLVSFLPLPLWDFFDLLLGWIYRLIEFLVSSLALVPGISISRAAPVLIFTILFWLLIIFLQIMDEEHRSRLASFD